MTRQIPVFAFVVYAIVVIVGCRTFNEVKPILLAPVVPQEHVAVFNVVRMAEKIRIIGPSESEQSRALRVSYLCPTDILIIHSLDVTIRNFASHDASVSLWAEYYLNDGGRALREIQRFSNVGLWTTSPKSQPNWLTSATVMPNFSPLHDRILAQFLGLLRHLFQEQEWYLSGSSKAQLPIHCCNLLFQCVSLIAGDCKLLTCVQFTHCRGGGTGLSLSTKYLRLIRHDSYLDSEENGYGYSNKKPYKREPESTPGDSNRIPRNSESLLLKWSQSIWTNQTYNYWLRSLWFGIGGCGIFWCYCLINGDGGGVCERLCLGLSDTARGGLGFLACFGGFVCIWHAIGLL